MAFPGTYNFNYYRGDTAQFVARPKNSVDGSAFDLSGYEGSFIIATVRGGGGTRYVATAVVNETSNIVTCTIPASLGRSISEGSYVYDVEIENGLEVYTLLTGLITVTDDIAGAV